MSNDPTIRDPSQIAATTPQAITAQPARVPFAFRLAGAFGWTLIGLALMAMASELLSAVETGRFRMVPAGELWFELDVGSLNLLQAVIQRFVHPYLWDPVIAMVLQWPAWSLLGAPGAVLISLAPARTEK